MSNCKAWVHATRPRTLPLALSGILAGSCMAASRGYFRLDIFFLAVLTAMSFQVLANWANDYGDGVRGTDNAARQGPKRAVSSGAITPRTMLRAIVLLSIVSIMLSMVLILSAFDSDQTDKILLFVVLGIVSVWAALGYTMGKSPYGYRTRGDLSVFLFFGLLAVQGGYYLYDHHFMPVNFFPAVSIGAFSVGALNLNNLRDHDSDKAVGKKTLVVKIGFEKAKTYHIYLMLIAYISTLIYNVLLERSPLSYLFLLNVMPTVCHVRRVFKADNPQLLYGELNRLALIALSFSVLFSLGELLAAVPGLNF